MTDRLIHESPKSKVFRRSGNADAVQAVKVLNYEFPTPDDIAQFYNEYDILTELSPEGVRHVLDKTREHNRHAMIFEWVPGEPLDKAFKDKRNDIVDALHIAIAAADALAKVHARNIIHKDVTPQNLIVDLQDRRVSLIDFGNATNLNLKQPYIGNPDRIEGTLAYVSPEQTGRMNRTVDHRSDLYSLGVTLYEMLTGAPPFAGLDALELVHAHLAQIPRPLTDHNRQVPQPLSDIVAKLLTKNADARYQSAHGLHADLVRCLAAFEQHGSAAPAFDLGTEDYSSTFRLPQKLYGREAEIDRIVAAFDTCAKGARSLMLVGGYSGTGKTALVHEVHKPITARAGYFCSGKFDQLQRATPYFAVLEAFTQLLDTLLTEDEAKLAPLRQKLQAALGDEGRVLTNLLPNLEHLIGPQPQIPDVGGAEAQNRCLYMFRKFVRALCSVDHPAVIFIDDLQWADSASLALLHALMTDPESGHLMLICAFRDNEVDPTHPFIRMIDEITETGLIPDCIQVGALSQDTIAQILSDSLNAETRDVAPLARLVFDKTQGNTFFAREFMKSFADENLLQFDFETARWQWDADRIAQKSVADNVVDLIAAKVRKLDQDVQHRLKLAACIGNRFDLQTLSWISNESTDALSGQLKPAFANGLILPLGGEAYKFSHDRIQQAVYSLIDADEKQQTHLRIGTRLQAHETEDPDPARIFDIANQLNLARGLITDRDAQVALAQLNLDAGRRAKLNAAFPTALDYLSTGIALMGPGDEPWSENYTLTLALYTEATEAAYLSGDFDQMDGWFREILTRSRDILEQVKPYEIRILAYKAQNKFYDAIETGLELLESLGETFPKHPNFAHVGRDLIATHLALRGRSNDDLMALPLMIDPRKSAAMRIIADIMSSVYWGRPNLVPLLVFRMVRLSLAHGNHPVSCFAYGAYGVLMCGVLGAMRTGDRYGQLALDLLDKLNAKEWKAQIYVTPYALIFHWNRHVRETLRPLQQSFQIGMETGLIEFACVNTNIYCIQAYLCGRPLTRIADETKAYSQLYLQFKQETNYNYNQVFLQAMQNFIGQSKDPVRLVGDAYDEDRMLAQNLERSDKTGTFFIHFNKLMLNTYFRRFSDAAEHAAASRKLLDAVLAKFEVPNHHFYEALCLIGLAETKSGRARITHLARARRDIAKLKRWSRFAPENYRHKYDLCIAELARIRGNGNVARLAYDRAIAGASENDYLHEQALAYELAGRFYADTGRAVLAEFHLKAAYTTYREWGAGAKLRDLADAFPKYLSGSGGDTATGAEERASTALIDGSALDITTVLKASTTISSEVKPTALLTVLMRLVLENAGAQRGFLLLAQDGEDALRVQARGDDGGAVLDVMQGTLLEEHTDLSVPIAQYVHRTGEPVVIADATSDARLRGQRYLSQHQPKSILCIPIVNQGKRVGVLYLENNLTTGAFTRDRVDLLTLLSGQIAVSIDNARLYAQLEQKVSERTAQLAQEKQKTDDLLLNILPAETAKELKSKGHADARYYERVTVLFTDFEGFTKLSSELSPDDLVREIDACFKTFDLICEKHRIEKIKTIGDAFMAVGGLPVPNSTHAENVLNAALEIRDVMVARNAAGEGYGMGLRIGVHTGPVVAGIVGLKKFQYDLWGDTVNTAARIETAGEVGRINVSQTTYDLVRDRFAFTFRGELAAKGKGKMPMYFADHLRDRMPVGREG
ncbi:adenylate/guanylate cyclase domain-containing protein [Gymnodinialimonas sp. 2305UL16-5]|uniref:adenylate/guanylate cyclase domain-containing protein n=1 Tax=Gymnodinialimonas mytili TaxID=3126503 RepID=UPI003095EDD4